MVKHLSTGYPQARGPKIGKCQARNDYSLNIFEIKLTNANVANKHA